MLIKEIKQIVSADGCVATFVGEDDKVDNALTEPVILWAICRCQDAGETFDAILGFVGAGDEGLVSTEDTVNFAGYQKGIILAEAPPSI